MRVLHVISGLNDGGAESVLLQLCLGDRQNSHVVVSMMDDGKYGCVLRSAGIEVHSLGMPPGRLTAPALWRLFRLIRERRPHVVQTWMYHADLVGGVLAKLARTSAVCWGIRTSTIDRRKLKSSTFFVAQQCARLSRFVPTRIISCSHDGARHHAMLGYASDRLIVIPNGYDIERLRPDAALRASLRATWAIEPDDVVVGMVARYDPLKDHANLAAAIAQLEHAGHSLVLVLAGEGLTDQNHQLVELLRANGVCSKVLLVGPQRDIHAVMNALDIHVLSSCMEGFPNVLAEAMACGTPCVSTNVGDAAMIVGDTGWVVPPRDSTALATSIAGALVARRDAPSWDQRTRAARLRIAQNFSLERMCDSYRSAWAQAFAERT